MTISDPTDRLGVEARTTFTMSPTATSDTAAGLPRIMNLVSPVHAMLNSLPDFGLVLVVARMRSVNFSGSIRMTSPITRVIGEEAVGEADLGAGPTAAFAVIDRTTTAQTAMRSRVFMPLGLQIAYQMRFEGVKCKSITQADLWRGRCAVDRKLFEVYSIWCGGRTIWCGFTRSSDAEFFEAILEGSIGNTEKLRRRGHLSPFS